jgi:hypothetical protein
LISKKQSNYLNDLIFVIESFCGYYHPQGDDAGLARSIDAKPNVIGGIPAGQQANPKWHFRFFLESGHAMSAGSIPIW